MKKTMSLISVICLMPKIVFVLHAFQKKSKQGIKTPKQEIDLIKKRFKEAQEIYKELSYGKEI